MTQSSFVSVPVLSAVRQAQDCRRVRESVSGTRGFSQPSVASALFSLGGVVAKSSGGELLVYGDPGWNTVNKIGF